METRLMSATEVAEQLGTSKAYAYKVIRKLNTELAKEGCLVVQDKVSRAYFEERFFARESMKTMRQVTAMSVSKDPKRETFYVQD